jgi:hypothetical protein
MDYITKEEFNKYSEYLKEEFKEINEKLSKCSSKDKLSEVGLDEEKYDEMNEKYNAIEEKFNSLIGFVNYLSEHLNKSIAHGDHVVENVMEIKGYVDYLAENLDNSISYNKYLTENVDKLISHNNHISSMVNKSLNFSDYLAENINDVMEEVENNRLYTEYVAEGADKGIQYAEYLGKKIDDGIQYSEHIAETVNRTANYTNYLAENLNKSINHSDHIVESINSKGQENDMKKVNENTDYQGSILSKLDLVINEAKRQKADADDKLHFMKFLDGDRINIFSSLNEADKVKVVKAFDGATYYSNADAAAIFEGALKPSDPEFISNMKDHHKALWAKLNEDKKVQILEQSKNYVLDTQEKIDYFWDTMDLRDEKVNLEPINEEEQKDKINNLAIPSDEYMKNFEKEMLERMG